jgi:hypothetical protein
MEGVFGKRFFFYFTDRVHLFLFLFLRLVNLCMMALATCVYMGMRFWAECMFDLYMGPGGGEGVYMWFSFSC